MRLVGVRDPGTHDERVLLRVVAPCDIGDWLLLSGYTQDGELDGDSVDLLAWLPNRRRSSGFVRIFTRSPAEVSPRLQINSKQRLSLYLSRPDSLWTSPDQVPVLLRVDSIQFRR